MCLFIQNSAAFHQQNGAGVGQGPRRSPPPHPQPIKENTGYSEAGTPPKQAGKELPERREGAREEAPAPALCRGQEGQILQGGGAARAGSSGREVRRWPQRARQLPQGIGLCRERKRWRGKRLGVLKRGYSSILLIKEKDTEDRTFWWKWRDRGKNKPQRDHSRKRLVGWGGERERKRE